jgi:lia operon protein LiaF
VRHGGKKQWFFSMILLLAGIVLLLLNICVISLEITQIFVNIIPILLVLTGLKWTVDGFLRKSFGKLFLGLFSLVYGSLIILDEWDKLEFEYRSWWKLWPLFIISIAISRTAFKRSTKLTVMNVSSQLDSSAGFEAGENFKEKLRNKINKNFIVGEVKLSEPNWSLEPMEFQKRTQLPHRNKCQAKA